MSFSEASRTIPSRVNSRSSSRTLTINSSTDTAHSAEDMDTDGIPILYEAIDTKPNQILIYPWFKNELSVKIRSHPKQKILEVHLPLDNSELIKKFLKEYIRPKIKYFIYYENKTHRQLFTQVLISLFRKETVKLYECTERVINVTDEKEQEEIVMKYHVGKTCHRGIKETISHLKRVYFWTNLEETVTSLINSCDTCKRMKYDRRPFKPQLQLTQTQSRPFQELFIDLFSIEGKYYLTILDAFSKLAQAFEIPDRSTPEVVRALIKYFSFYGVPTKISSDPGSEFNNKLMKDLMTLYKIDIHIGTPNNPNSMGLIERFHSTILEIYRLAKYEHKFTDATSVMTYAIMAYNQTIHSVTGLTPFEVVFGHTENNNQFNLNFDKEYTQQLVRDHAKRTHYLYKYLTDKIGTRKEKVQQSRVGETNFDLNEGDNVFIKGINRRRSKDKPRFVLLVTQAVTIRALQLQKVEKNPGVLPLREGTAMITYDKWIVIKTLDIKLIKEELEFNMHRYIELNRIVELQLNTSSPSLIYFNDVKLQVNYMLNITLNKYSEIVPINRQKRGLINPLGSLVKMITGNLDYDDAIKYDNLIKNVKSREHSLEKKTTVISEMIRLVANSTINITNNLEQLSDAINKINKNIKDISIISHVNQITHIYNSFLHNFQIIYTKLTEIENILAFSRMGVLHQSIINTNELINVLRIIEKTDKLIFKVIPENIVRIEQSMTLKSYFKNNVITLVLEIPLVKKETYFYYKIVPLPITQPETNLTLIILPKYPYLIAKGLKAKSLSTPCKNIEEEIYLCDELQTMVPVEDTCILDLMKYSHNVSCKQIPIEFEEIKVELLQINRWIIYSKSPVDLVRTCDNEILHYTLINTYLLTIEDKCQYNIANHNLRIHSSNGEKLISQKLPLVNLPENLKISIQSNINPVKLNGVDLTNLKVLSYALQNSENQSDSVVKTNSVSLGTIILYVILILSLISFLAYKKIKTCIIFQGRNHPPKNCSSDDFELKEGKVTMSHRYPNSTVSVNAINA
ncbi:uncharacterized protein LOC125061448 [Pieris napi]|uniref:uncharacterized protein LOC125061448 n=1 Tax=Pieris napi TaxID=78633 RepID=UPI001FB8BB43|nr:uncharacterized protein LOC125061448 [Pieris napi]